MAKLSCYYNSILETIPNRENRPFLDFIIEKAEESKVLVVEAPTGYGKSIISQTIALYTLKEGLKSIITFPLRSLLEDQFFKFRNILLKLNCDDKNIGVRYMHHPESRYLLKPITLTTVDTLSLTLFGIAPEDLESALKYYDGTLTRSMGHYLFSRSMVLLSNVILDEVHLLSDMTKSLSFLIALIWILAKHGRRIVLMSATIPRALEDILREEGEEVSLNFAKFSEKPDEKFIWERKSKKYELRFMGKLGNDKFEKILKEVEEGRREGFKRSIVVFNTISEAIKFYEIIKNNSNIPKNKILLIHSRFTEKDREMKIRKIEEFKQSDEYLIITTQVIEAGVDISSNLFISDMAPASSLIQRLGRFLRYRDEKEGRVCIWYENYENRERNRYKGIYDLDLFERTLNFLENKNIRFHEPESYQPLLDDVYDENSFSLNREYIKKFILIPNILENPYGAIELFISCEGSFIRKDILVPVVPSSLLSEHMTINELEKYLIPMNLSTLFRLKPVEELVVNDSDPQKVSRGRLNEKIWWIKRKHMLRKVFSSKFIAFVVEGSYNEDTGLVVKYEKDSKLLQEGE
jgi:CRISPR-associated endonuclease/helicase Cas3